MSERTLAITIVILCVAAMLLLGHCAEWFVPTDPPVGPDDYASEAHECEPPSPNS